MKNIKCLLVVIFYYLNVSPSNAKPELISLIPEDSFLLLEIDDLTEFSDQIEEGPLGEFVRSDGWDKISQWMIGEFKDDFSSDKANHEFIIDILSEWMDSFNGQMIFSISGLEHVLDKKVPHSTLLLETELKEKDLAESLKTLKKEILSSGGKISLERDEISGVVVHWIDSETNTEKDNRIALSIFDQTFGIFSGGRDYVKETLLRLEKDSKSNSIAKNDNYLDVFDEIGRGKARLFLNFDFLEDFLEEIKVLPNVQIPENPFGIKTPALLDAFGLNSLECIGMHMDPSGKEFKISSAAFLSKYDGLFSFLQFSETSEAIPYDFIPPQSFSATCGRYDFGKLWQRVEKIVGELSPQLLLLMNSQIQAFEDQAGVAFRRDVLGSFGDEVATFGLLEKELKDLDDLDTVNPTFYAISLKDSQLFDRSLRTMIDAFSAGNDLFEERVHKGVTIRKIRGLEQVGLSISYAVTDKWFILGMGDDIHFTQMINQLNGNKNSLWKNDGVRKALKDMPNGVRQIDYVNLNKMVSFFKPLIMNAMGDEEEVKLKSNDFADLPYFIFAWSKNVKRGMIGRAELFPISKK